MQKYRHPRKSDTTTVGQAIGDMLKTYNLTKKFDEKKLIESWGRVMGTVIEKRTKRIFIKNTVLFVEVTSAPLKNELSMSKDKVIDLLTKEVGEGIITEVIFM